MGVQIKNHTRKRVDKMKDIHIYYDEVIGGFYTISIDGKTTYECLAKDEVVDVVKELMQER